MSDQPLVLEVPEDLVRRVKAAGIDVRQIAIEALEKEVARRQASQDLLDMFAQIDAMPDDLKPTPEEINEMVQQARSEIYAERHKIADNQQ